MNSIKIVSFDAEGTLVTPRFSQRIWHEGIPTLYARKNGLNFEDARVLVTTEYDRLGDQAPEWYDVRYWLERFELGDYHQLLDEYRRTIFYYPDVEDTLTTLGRDYKLIVASSTAREFLDPLLEKIRGYFATVFSAISDYREVKSTGFYRMVCRTMGVEPAEMVHVGDSRHFDFTIPREAGIRAFHLDRDGVEPETDGVITDLRELAGRLESP